MDATKETLQRLRNNVLQRLESLVRAGVRQIPRVRGEVPAAAPCTPTAATEFAQRERGTVSRGVKISGGTDRRSQLAVVQREVAACTRCAELARTRTQTVFGTGDTQARLCFMGEAPGADEDRQGEPFVGRAGQLLTDIIQKGMGLRREEVYILNVLKCRPPGNRTPAVPEVANCRPYFERQLEILNPPFICCLGLVAAQALLESTLSVGKLRGQFHTYQRAKVLVTYHPSYLLRAPEMKKETWKDIQMLMSEMGLPLPAKKGL